jgi:hypothetical protein
VHKVLLSILLLFQLVAAQTLSLSLSADDRAWLEPEVILSQLELRGTQLELRLAGGISSGLEFGVRLRERASFGPAGNALLSGHADFRSDGLFALSLAAEGVIGPIAASLTGSLLNSDPSVFRLEDAFTQRQAPLFAKRELAASLELSASYRPSRLFIFSISPALYFKPAATAIALGASANWLKALDPDDLSLSFQGQLEPSQNYAALGFAYKLNRRNLPAFEGTLWLGAGSKGFWPGLTVELHQALRAIEASYQLNLWLEPYRAGFPSIRAQTRYQQSLGAGTIKATALGSLGSEQLPQLALLVSYGFKLE